jgi:hypothetical protein
MYYKEKRKAKENYLGHSNSNVSYSYHKTFFAILDFFTFYKLRVQPFLNELKLALWSVFLNFQKKVQTISFFVLFANRKFTNERTTRFFYFALMINWKSMKITEKKQIRHFF